MLKGTRIFIVEDNVRNMAIYSVLLRKMGAEVFQDHWQHNTIESMCRVLPLDIILLDLMLKQNISGYDIFSEISRHDILSKVPVVAVSAADASIEIPKAKEMGFSGYIAKPIQAFHFPGLIKQVLAGENIWVDTSWD